jgi:opacity protein-like surface antigen
MAVRKLFLAACFAFIATVAAPRSASADWLFTPFIGSTFGGSANLGGPDDDFKEEFERKLNYGASLAAQGAGPIGFEIDFGYSPSFFGLSDDSDFNLTGDGNVTTLTGNLLIGPSVGRVRPYVVGGIGLIRSKVDNPGGFFDKVSTNDFGFDAGAGIVGLFSENVGLRGDIRFFRSLRDPDPDSFDLALGSFKFWRGTVGVTFKF